VRSSRQRSATAAAGGTPRGIVVEHPQHEARDVGGDGRLVRAEAHGELVAKLLEHREVRLGAARRHRQRAAEHHARRDEAEAVDVALRTLDAVEALGRHELQRAEHDARGVRLALIDVPARDAEVEELHFAAERDPDVRRLDVAVDEVERLPVASAGSTQRRARSRSPRRSRAPAGSESATSRSS
jgi:hypothetical protein